jgi:hypothetical protein
MASKLLGFSVLRQTVVKKLFFTNVSQTSGNLN